VTELTLRLVNDNVYSVHGADGAPVGNLKRIGMVWKFKAIGFDVDGSVIPGGGPFTHRHNTVFAEPGNPESNQNLLLMWGKDEGCLTRI
jgi:hypothetical protein